MRRPQVGLYAALLCWLVSACALVPAGTPTPTALPTSTATPLPTPTATPTPTPIPEVRVEAADYALFTGDWDRAIEEYGNALAQASDAAIHSAARLGLAKARLRSGDPNGAVAEALAFLEAFPDSPERAQALFVLGEAYRAQGTWGAAVEVYQQYLRLQPGLVDSYIHERIAQAHEFNTDWASAAEAYRLAIEAPRLGDVTGLRERLAEAYRSQEKFDLALAEYEAIYASTDSDYVRARMDWLAGNVLLQIGQTNEAHEKFLDAVNDFPASNDSYQALVELVNAGVPVDDYRRGLVDYFAGQYEPAIAAFDRYLVATPDHDARPHYYTALSYSALGDYDTAAETFQEIIDTHPNDELWSRAWFELGRMHWALQEDPDSAIDTFLGFAAAAPDHAQAPEAIYRAGWVAELFDDLPRAVSIWTELLTDYPESDYAQRTAFDLGIVLYRLGDFPAAQVQFAKALELATAPDLVAAAHLWIGKTQHAQADVEGARAAWQQAIAANPTGYYSLRAQDLLDDRPPFAPPTTLQPPVDPSVGQAEAEDWMRATFTLASPNDLSSLSLALQRDPRLIRGNELWQLGLYSEARAEFESLREDIQGDAEATYRLMHHLLDLRLYRSAIFCARQVLRMAGLDDAATLDPSVPIFFNHIRFGRYYASDIEAAAQTYGVDAWLIYAVVRQESLFEGFVTSSAAARGLMQVIPSTGRAIADRIDWPNYQDSDLYRPSVSVIFGTYYLAQQHEAFDGDWYAALAAYNAGPGNAAAWKEDAPNDPDLYLEVIRIAEPQNYIRRVYEIYSVYRTLYGADER